MQTILISVHIPKTGGTSFRRMLEGYYGDAFQPDYDWEPRPDIMNGRDLTGTDMEIREALKNVRCIHGHFNVKKYLRLRDLEGIEPVFVTWVRDPIERAVSTYYFLRALNTPPENQPDWQQKANVMSLEQFYSETPYGNDEQAKQAGALNPEEYAFIGLTERYTESMTLFAHLFFPTKELPAIPHELKNQQRNGEKYDISPAAQKILTDRNTQDFRFYEHAKGWLSRALSAHTPVGGIA